MATRKAAKKATKKVTRSTLHRTDDHSFLIIVGGGFVIIAILMMLLGNRPAVTDAVEESTQLTTLTENSEQVISIADNSFTPEELTIKVGTTVTWKNDDMVTHSAVSDEGLFDTKALAPGEKGSYTFTEPGVYTYHCGMHPEMTGTIVVE